MNSGCRLPGKDRFSAQGFGISQSTAYLYKDEDVEILAWEVPSLEQALEKPLSKDFPISSWTAP